MLYVINRNNMVVWFKDKILNRFVGLSVIVLCFFLNVYRRDDYVVDLVII